MKRTEELECKLDQLLKEYEDLSYEEIAEILEYRANEYQAKANRS